MFEIAEQLMIQFVNLMPEGIAIILVLNIVSDLLFNTKERS